MPLGQLLPQLTKRSPELVLANYAHGSQETYPGELLHSPGFDLVIIFRSNPVVLFWAPPRETEETYPSSFEAFAAQNHFHGSIEIQPDWTN